MSLSATVRLIQAFFNTFGTAMELCVTEKKKIYLVLVTQATLIGVFMIC